MRVKGIFVYDLFEREREREERGRGVCERKREKQWVF
jgi:hypothetical protein